MIVIIILSDIIGEYDILGAYYGGAEVSGI